MSEIDKDFKKLFNEACEKYNIFTCGENEFSIKYLYHTIYFEKDIERNAINVFIKKGEENSRLSFSFKILDKIRFYDEALNYIIFKSMKNHFEIKEEIVRRWENV